MAPAKKKGPLAKKSLSTIEREIEELEGKMAEIDEEMLDPDVYLNGERCRALQKKRGKHAEALTPLEAEWARRAEEG